MDFDLAPKEVPVTVGGVKYVLREASEGAAIAYRNVVLRSNRINDKDGTRVIDGIADAEPLLVSMCLCQTNGDGGIKRDKEGNPVTVPKGVILGWPSRVVDKLFDEAQRISGLLEKKEKEPEPNPTPAASSSPGS